MINYSYRSRQQLKYPVVKTYLNYLIEEMALVRKLFYSKEQRIIVLKERMLYSGEVPSFATYDNRIFLILVLTDGVNIVSSD